MPGSRRVAVKSQVELALAVTQQDHAAAIPGERLAGNGAATGAGETSAQRPLRVCGAIALASMARQD